MESTGTLRDMISTHLFQLLGFVALDPPSRFDAESLHHEMTKVFRAIRPPDPDRVVFGQYDGYRDEAGVEPGIDRRDVRRHGGLRRRLDLDRACRSTCAPASRWPRPGAPSRSASGSPRSRSFPATSTTPATSWSSTSPTTRRSSPMSAARFPGRGSRWPGPDASRPAGVVPGAEPLEAYERLLLDVLRGDPTLSITTEEIELLWRLFDPLLRHPPRPRSYPRHSWGPDEALRLPGSRGWRLPDSESGTQPVDP